MHSSEARATSPGFREVRYISRDLTRRGAGTVTDTPGPGQYNIRVPLRRGTTFAGPRPKCGKTATVRAFVASATTAAAVASSSERAGQQERRDAGADRGARPSPPAPAAVSQRLSTPLMGKESPGPAYKLPSDFDLKLVNKKTFHPPRCYGGGTRAKRQVPRDREPAAATSRGGQGATRKNLPRARRELSRVAAANSRGGCSGAGAVVGVPVKTSLGRGFLLRIRADGMTFVRLPWGVLYSREVFTRGNALDAAAAAASLEDPASAVPNSEGGGVELLPTAVQADGGVDAALLEEGRRREDEWGAPQPTGGP